MREWYGSLGGEKVVDLMVVDEESLRSDTRLPLESSPYMAGKILTVQLAACLFAYSSLNTVANDMIYFLCLHVYRIRIILVLQVPIKS